MREMITLFAGACLGLASGHLAKHLTKRGPIHTIAAAILAFVLTHIAAMCLWIMDRRSDALALAAPSAVAELGLGVLAGAVFAAILHLASERLGAYPHLVAGWPIAMGLVSGVVTALAFLDGLGLLRGWR